MLARTLLRAGPLWLLLLSAPAAAQPVAADVAPLIAASSAAAEGAADTATRARIMIEVARMQALAGDPQAARATLVQVTALLPGAAFSDDRAKETVTGRAAVAHAAAGEADDATFLGGAILDETIRSLALRDVAADAANRGAVEEARAWLARIEDADRRVDALAPVVEARLRAGDATGARALIKDAVSAVAMLRESARTDPNAALAFAFAASVVAGLQGRAGYPAAAEATGLTIDALLEGLEDETLRAIVTAYAARAHAAAGGDTVALAMVRDGLALADRLEDADLMLLLVVAQAEAGDVAGAIENVTGRVNALRRMVALAAIARFQAEAGDVTGAMRTAGLIAQDDPSRIQAHLDIALAADDEAAARAALGIASEAAIRSGSSYDLRLVAGALAWRGDRAAALETVRRIGDVQVRTEALGDILSILAAAG